MDHRDGGSCPGRCRPGTVHSSGSGVTTRADRHRAVVPPVAENRTEAPIETVGASGTSLDSAGAGTGDRAIDITQARVLGSVVKIIWSRSPLL